LIFIVFNGWSNNLVAIFGSLAFIIGGVLLINKGVDSG